MTSANEAWAYKYKHGKNVRYLGIESYRGVHIYNWAQNVQFNPELVFLPQTRDDLVAIVKDAGKNNKRITLIGKGHSWNPLMEGSSYLISTIKMNKFRIHPEDSSVTVEPGATIAQVDTALEKQGFMVPCNIVGTTDITYGGVMATGSHGSGRNCPTMSDFIEEIEFVKGNGEIEVVSEATHGAEVMNAARLNLGLFGVMSKIKFRVQKAFNVQVTDHGYPIGKLFDVLPDLLRKNENVEILWFPMTDRAIVKTWNHTTKPVNPGPLNPRTRVALTKWFLYKGFVSLVKWFMEHPSRLPGMASIIGKNLFPDRTYVQPVDQAIHYVNEAVIYPIHETEIAIPYDFDNLTNVKTGWDAMIKGAYDSAKAGKYALNIIAHMRFIKSSNALLSPSLNNTRTCYMDFGSYYKTPGWDDLVNEVWATWHSIPGVKLHWAKDMRAYADLDVHTMYGPENVARFLRIRESFDPQGIFANDFMKRLFKF
jgi:L-gulonolactone oxidase